MRAALGRRDRVDLVDDHGLRVAKQLARSRRQHQVERLRRRDQDVRRMAQHRRALAGRRVAGADRNADVEGEAAQRSPQIALDVVGERLQRRDVDEARSRLARRRALTHELVECPEERRERLARACRCRDQDVLAGCDRRPGLGLGGRWGLEGVLEPRADLWRKCAEWHHHRRYRPGRPASSRARARTASIIGSVSRPVKVFCWLGW